MRTVNFAVALSTVICLLALGLTGFTSAGSGFGHPQQGQFTANDFLAPDQCAMCHTLQHDQWQGTMHDLATEDPFYLRVVKIAREDIPGIDDYCSACHSPIAKLTGQDPLDPENLSGPEAHGINCDFCHTVSGMRQLFNSGYESSPGNVKRGPFGTEDNMFHESELSELHDSAEFCGMCHDVNHPVNGLALESTYSEFIDGPYPAEDYKCQTCHMTPGLIEHEDFPGVIANGQDEYDHIWTHWFVGANAWIPEMLGNDKPAEIARKRLSMAAEVAIANASLDGGTLSFDVAVTNSGAGHKLPTGVTEERQIWLEVRVLDTDGGELANFGVLDADGNIPEDTMILGTLFGDADGNPTHKIWFAETVLWDRRIAPRETDTEHYTVDGAADAAAIEVQLYYRSSHQSFVDKVFADTPEREIVPSIPMASARLEL